MVTNYPQQLTATAGIDAQNGESLMNRTVSRVNQLLCGLRGHDTPGWEVSGREPRRRYEGDARRHALAPQRLMLRKTA